MRKTARAATPRETTSGTHAALGRQKCSWGGPLSMRNSATMKTVRPVKNGCIRSELARGSPARKTKKCTARNSSRATAAPSTGDTTQLATVLAMAGASRESHPCASAPTPMRPPTMPCVALMGSL